MSKQIKIGFDKVPAPITKVFPQLVDSLGIPLTDAAGNPLYTEEGATLDSFGRADNSLSSHINNDKKTAVPVIEQFPSQSEVSTTLLGVERSEQQLGLFSDVSTYGLNQDDWDFNTFTNIAAVPAEWYSRKNPYFGNRHFARFVEGSNEQALYLESFPVQWTFYPGPTPLTEANFDFEDFRLYQRFIACGRYLYEVFKDQYPVFAKNNFIDENVSIRLNTKIPETIGTDNEELQISDIIADLEYADLVLAGNADPTKNKDSLFIDYTNLSNSDFIGSANWYTIRYGDDLSEAFDAIERFTIASKRIVDGTFKFPALKKSDGTSEDFEGRERKEYGAIRGILNTKSKPGLSSSIESFGVIESQKAFRYQPGRISGFTFGVRMNTDRASSDNYIEWGCSNDTDEYMFQLRGEQFSIVRRSTIPMDEDLLIRMNLDPESQVFTYREGLDSQYKLYETVIPRAKFNGDTLLGSGRSGYTLSFDDVTMYKIEFGWYGAIGAKFYAFVPVGVGEARWVLIHTLVTENGISGPNLRNADFKFKYFIYSSDNKGLEAPIYIFKYGSSYYIDGGDEGTVSLSSVSAPRKLFSARTPIVGVLPKNEIVNSSGLNILTSDDTTDSDTIRISEEQLVRNRKRGYIDTISAVSTATARIDFEEIYGSPDGFHYHYSPGLTTRTINGGISSRSTTTQMAFVPTSGLANRIARVSGFNDVGDPQFESFQSYDFGSKIIANGIYGTYLTEDENFIGDVETPFLRVSQNYSKLSYPMSEVVIRNGEKFYPARGEVFDGRLSNYNEFAGSTVPINSDEFKVHFINTTPRDGAHFAEFLIGFTYKRPGADITDPLSSDIVRQEDIDNYPNLYSQRDLGQLQFEGRLLDLENDAISIDWVPATIVINLEDEEIAEADYNYGFRFDTDPRLSDARYDTGGRIASIAGLVDTLEYPVQSVELETDNSSEFFNNYKITFSSSAPNADIIIPNKSEVGFLFRGATPNPVIYTSTILRPEEGGQAYAYVNIDPAVAFGVDEFNRVQVRRITLKDDWRVKSFNQSGERFGNQKFLLSKVLQFNIKPLYIFFGFRDKSEVESIVVEELLSNDVRTHQPDWLTSSGVEIVNKNVTYNNNGIAIVQQTDVTKAPGLFLEEKRLSGFRYDTQTTQPLKAPDYKVIYSLYIGKNDTEIINLNNVFGADRKIITPGLLNNRAYYITATALETLPPGETAEIEMTITMKEQ